MSKTKGLFLDDERAPKDVTWVNYPESIDWTVVRSYDDFSMSFIGRLSRRSPSTTISGAPVIVE